MNTILGELGKNPKFCEYIKTIESKKTQVVFQFNGQWYSL